MMPIQHVADEEEEGNMSATLFTSRRHATELRPFSVYLLYTARQRLGSRRRSQLCSFFFSLCLLFLSSFPLQWIIHQAFGGLVFHRESVEY